MQVFHVPKTRRCEKTKVFLRVYSMHIFKALILVNKKISVSAFINVSRENEFFRIKMVEAFLGEFY